MTLAALDLRTLPSTAASPDAPGAAVLRPRHLADEEAERPAVGDDVVLGCEQQVVALAEACQGGAHQRPVRQIEGGLRLLSGEALPLGLARPLRQAGQVHQRQREGA